MDIFAVKEGSDTFSDGYYLPDSCRPKHSVKDRIKRLKKEIDELEKIIDN